MLSLPNNKPKDTMENGEKQKEERSTPNRLSQMEVVRVADWIRQAANQSRLDKMTAVEAASIVREETELEHDISPATIRAIAGGLGINTLKREKKSLGIKALNTALRRLEKRVRDLEQGIPRSIKSDFQDLNFDEQ